MIELAACFIATIVYSGGVREQVSPLDLLYVHHKSREEKAMSGVRTHCEAASIIEEVNQSEPQVPYDAIRTQWHGTLWNICIAPVLRLDGLEV